VLVKVVAFATPTCPSPLSLRPPRLRNSGKLVPPWEKSFFYFSFPTRLGERSRSPTTTSSRFSNPSLCLYAYQTPRTSESSVLFRGSHHIDGMPFRGRGLPFFFFCPGPFWPFFSSISPSAFRSTRLLELYDGFVPGRQAFLFAEIILLSGPRFVRLRSETSASSPAPLPLSLRWRSS